MDDITPAAPASAGRGRWSSLRRRIAPISIVIAAVVVVLDQLTKHWAVNALSDGAERHVVWTLQFNLAFNTGMAFSRGRGLGPVIALLAVPVIIVLVVSTARVESRTARIAAGLMIGGALGNLTDRVFRGDGWLHGAVVDFIDVQWWPIFNVADIGVSVGAVLFAISALVVPREPNDGAPGVVEQPAAELQTDVPAAASDAGPSS